MRVLIDTTDATKDQMTAATALVGTSGPCSSKGVLPRRPRHGRSLPAFFAGLPPEGRRRTALRQGVETSADDELSLLLRSQGRSGVLLLRVRWVRKWTVPPLERYGGCLRFASVVRERA